MLLHIIPDDMVQLINTRNAQTEFVDHVLYLTKKSSNEIVDTFISTLIAKVSGNQNLIFIGKILKGKKFPNIIFYESLKVLFKEKLQ